MIKKEEEIILIDIISVFPRKQWLCAPIGFREQTFVRDNNHPSGQITKNRTPASKNLSSNP